MSPFQILMKNRSVILAIYERQGSIRQTHNESMKVIPEIKEIKYNTFKQYMPRLIEIAKQLEEETQGLVLQKEELEQALQDLKNKSDQSDIPPGEKIKVDGWNVVKGKDGYFRANRKIKGKVVSVYLGKKFNEEKAREKIRAKIDKMT